MQLNPYRREFYTLELAVTDHAGDVVPDAGPWEASFDNGGTWVTGDQDIDTTWWQWLVAGEKVTEAVPVGATLAATITETCQPIARLVDSPEILAEYCPRIYYAA